MSLKTHLQVLEESAEKYPTRSVFQIPIPSPGSTEVREWRPIIYSQFKSDVETYAKYWAKVFSADGLPRRSVVGLWLAGLSYPDVVHIYGVARASYIPQLFSLRLPNPDVIYELLYRANALALIHDPSFAEIVLNSPVPTHPAEAVSSDDVGDELLSPLANMAVDEADIIMIFHTSGSTSGSPKLVRCSLKWVDNIVSKSEKVTRPKDPERQDVSVWMGSVCHIGQTFMLIGALQHGSCTIQPSAISFSSSELMYMIAKCSLNRLNQFSTFLSTHLRNSQNNPKLLNMLSGLDEVLYSGLPLGRDEEQWAFNNGIKIRNLFGNTECGAMLLSIGGDGEDSRLLRPIEGTSYDFTSTAPTASSSQSVQTVHINANSDTNLLELVIRSDSGDCPDPSLRHPDGNYHTGDLFLEVKPQSYAFRGRDDDWIKSENALRCDTKAIEDNVLATCADLVESCIVVGNGRPSPVLFIEPKAAIASGRVDKLKRDIIRWTRPFHARRFMHERIVETKFVVVVPKGTLPRTATKGNIRRKAVEEAFKDVLDRIYGVI
ncbi:acetyl-CoA synthetase-like protein [Irpex rosettiformis]|uniref:Acetyl-CoA synthetase-like protein n=1 Tax=Irpex rosettiformis TaxID=378272 RepID=A0ACB8U6A7_9APHY|nr:acetyl-CoA synthetase-like protein [Irpex rosettiformis]